MTHYSAAVHHLTTVCSYKSGKAFDRLSAIANPPAACNCPGRRAAVTGSLGADTRNGAHRALNTACILVALRIRTQDKSRAPGVRPPVDLRGFSLSFSSDRDAGSRMRRHQDAAAGTYPYIVTDAQCSFHHQSRTSCIGGTSNRDPSL